MIRRYVAEGSPTGYDAAQKLLSPVPAKQMNAVLEALDQGLSERAGTPKLVDTALFADAGKALVQNGVGREYAAVNRPLWTYVSARWQESKSDPLRARVALRANVPGVEEYLIAQKTPSALQVLEELGSAKIVPSLLTFLDANQPEAIRLLSIRTLARFGDPTITAK